MISRHVEGSGGTDGEGTVRSAGRADGGDGRGAHRGRVRPAGRVRRRRCAERVRRALRARQVDLPRAEIDELVGDAALVLFEHAGSWRPEGGALPWVWAQHRIVNAVDRHLGCFADHLDDDKLSAWEVAGRTGRPGPAPGDEPDTFELLESLAGRDPRLRALADALNEVATPEGPGDVAGDAGAGGAGRPGAGRVGRRGATACRRRRPASSGTGWASGCRDLATTGRAVRGDRRAAVRGVTRAAGPPPVASPRRERSDEEARRMAHQVRGVVAKAKGEPVDGRDHRGARPGSRRGAGRGAGLRRLPHRPALPRGRDQRRVPVPARPRGGRRDRGGRPRRHRGGARRLRDPELAGRLRRVPVLPAGATLVLLRHPQRHPEDDPRRRRALARRWASAPSPRRPWWPPARPPRSIPGPSPRPRASSAAGSWPASAPRCSPARWPGATRWPCSAAAAWATPPSPGPGWPGRRRSSRSTSTPGSWSWPASSAPPTPSTRRPPIRSRRSASSPTATAPTCASRRWATPR